MIYKVVEQDFLQHSSICLSTIHIIRGIIHTGGEEMTAGEILQVLKTDDWVKKSEVTVPVHSVKNLRRKTLFLHRYTFLSLPL